MLQQEKDMPNFSIALTGLQADTVSLNTIGNNLSNLNTTAFKAQSTTFSDLFYQHIGTAGSGDALQVGVGTRVSGTATNYTQGSLSTTQNSTDMALSGAGFFLVQRGHAQALTRAGNFQMNQNGYLTTANGENLMGYGVTNGVGNLNGGLIPLQLPVTQNQPAQSTKNISLTTSLDSTAATGSQFSSPVTLYDSLGVGQAASVTYTKTGAAPWSYAITLPVGTATGTPVNNTGTLTFDSSGKLVTPAANVSGITFPTLADGAQDLAINFNLYGNPGTALISQTAGASNTTLTKQDGYAAGVYQSFAVSADGVVSATFSNGQTSNIGQVAIGMVVNQAGLTRAGANDYVTSDVSGGISVGVANVGGRGAIDGEALEQSNVDISAEFSALIVAQRAFEANSKTVTTFDSVTQQAIAMIR
jgi:flagellar hook protein FlgE